jgi:hypothetical protein
MRITFVLLTPNSINFNASNLTAQTLLRSTVLIVSRSRLLGFPGSHFLHTLGSQIFDDPSMVQIFNLINDPDQIPKFHLLGFWQGLHSHFPSDQTPVAPRSLPRILHNGRLGFNQLRTHREFETQGRTLFSQLVIPNFAK